MLTILAISFHAQKRQGLCFAADAMEVLLLSFLSVILTVEWGLEKHQNDTLISVVFLGAMSGTLVLSPLGDRIGRRPVFSLTAAIIALFGIGTALCSTYEALLFARFMVGFGVGGLVVPFDTLAEFLPSDFRGPNLLVRSFIEDGSHACRDEKWSLILTKILCFHSTLNTFGVQELCWCLPVPGFH